MFSTDGKSLLTNHQKSFNINSFLNGSLFKKKNCSFKYILQIKYIYTNKIYSPKQLITIYGTF